MTKKIILSVVIVLISMAAIAQDEKLRVAVFDPTSTGTSIDEGTRVAVREIISSTFVNTGKYNIVERSLLQQVMKEQAFSNTDVVDESQATELGRLAGANKVVLSVVSLVGGRNMVSVKTIDVKTATVDQQKTKVVSSSELLDVIEPLTLELLGEKASTETIIKSSTPATKQKSAPTTKAKETYSNETPSFDGDYALLHIYRPNSPMGAMIGYDIHLNDEVIGRAKNKSKMTVQIRDFGPTTIWAKTESRVEISINFEPGREYYLRCGMKMGVVTGRPTLELMENSVGKSAFDSMK